MVAVVAGSGLGLTNSSRALLGGAGSLGNGTSGRSGEQVYLNSATGNLVIQDRDEYLTGIGLRTPITRTYNSQGLMVDDNGDNWRLGVHQKLSPVTGTLNAAGSTITKTFGDGSEVVYTYSTTLTRYVSTDGDGAHDTLSWNAGTSQWTWTEGTKRVTETYDSAGRLIQSRDQDGNLLTYNYTGALLTSIADNSTPQQTYFFDYTGNNLTAIRAVSNGVTQTLTRYTYDGQNRLSEVRVDLLPADNSIADGRIFLTTYTYDGTSKRVLSISQGNGVTVGSTVSFTYELLAGQYRVKTFTDAEGRVSTYNYTLPSGSGGSSTTVPANSGVLSTTEQQPTTNTYNLNSGALSTAAQINPLFSDIPITNLSGTTGTAFFYKIEVPAGASALFIQTEASNGDADMYVRQGQLPTFALYDAVSATEDSNEMVYIANPAAGTWYVAVGAYSSFTNLRLMASVQTGTSTTQTLTPGTAVHDISGGWEFENERMFSFNVPAGTSNFRLTMSGANGDADMYVRQGTPPTHTSYTHVSEGANANEVITVTSPAAGTWYVLVKTWDNTSDAHLVLHTNIGTNTPPTVDAGTHRSVANGASVTLTGTASDAQGAVTYLWSQVSGTAVTLSGTTTANATFTAPTVTTPTTLVFRLRVTDSAGATNDDIVRILVGAPATIPNPVNWSTPETLESSATAASQLLAGASTAGATVAVWQQGSTLSARAYNVSTHTWSAAVTVSGSSTTPTAQKLYVDSASGNAVLVWRDSANGEIRVNRYIASSGTWQGSELVATVTSPNTVSDLTASINGTGLAGVVWLETNGTTKTLRIRRYSGSSWAAAETVTTATGTTTVDTVQFIINNATLNQVVWRQSSGTNFLVNGRAYTTTWGSVVQINPTPTAQVAQIKVHSDPSGDVNVYWVQGGGSNQIMGTYGGNATWAAPTTRVSGPAAIASYALHDSQGAWAFAFVTTNNRVYASHAPYSGPRLEPYWELYSGTAVGDVNVDITPTSGVVVTWRDGNDVWAQRWVGGPEGYWRGAQRLETASGAAATPYAFVNADTGGATDNEAVAIWRQNDGTADSIYFSRYTFTDPSAPVTPYYTVQAGDTWATIAQTLYGSNTAATQLQTALGNPTLTTGLQLTGFPASLVVTTTTTVTVPAYYIVPAGATWTSITQAIYGTSDANAVAALQAATGSPALTTNLHLPVPLNLTYSTGGGGTTTYLQTDLTDALGLVTSFVSDANGRLTGVLSPTTGGARIERRYAYDASGNVTSITEDPTGLNRVTTMQYDANGNLTLTRDSFGNTVTRTYSATNQLLTETAYTVPDPDGGGSGQPSGALTARYAYDSEDHLRFVVTADGRVIEHRYNANGTRSTTIQYTDAVYDISALSATTAITEAQLTTWAGARTLTLIQRIDYAYDFRGNVSTRTAFTTTNSSGAGVTADSSLTRYVYDQRGQLITSFEERAETTPADATDFVTNYTYDGLGRLLTAVQWMSATDTRTTTNVYDDALNRTTVTLANGLVTVSSYNKVGDLISVANSGPSITAGTTTYTYDAGGRQRFITNPTGQRQFRLYDEASRLVGAIDVDGTLTEYIYDRTNRLIKTVVYSERAPSATLASLVDVNDRPTNVTLATVRTSITSIAGYDLNRDQVTRAVYDSAGRQEFAIDQVGAVTRFVYDGAGRLVEEVHYATAFSIPRATDQVLPAAVTPTTSVDDRRTRHFYDNAGNRLATLDAAGYLIENTYDAAGRLTRQLRYADATPTSFRLTGTLSQLRPALDNETVTDPERDITTYFFYDGQGRRTGELDGEGYLTEISYNVASLMSQKVRYNQVLAYTAGATLASLKALVLPASTRQTTTFAYDNVGRLQRETNYESTATVYAYDKLDNVTSVTRAADTAEARTMQTRYDALGRVIAELTAQGSAQITGGMTPAQIDAVWNQYAIRYVYDASGRRVSATDQNNNVTLFYYDVDGRLTHTVNALGEVEESRYNALGQAVEVIRYFNRISTATLTGGLVNSTLTSRVTTAADATRDAKTTLVYTLRGEVDRTTTAENAVTSQLYNAFGEVRESTKWIDATRSLTHQYRYDTLGQLKETRWDPAGLNTVETYDYDGFGRRTRTTDANGNITRAIYDRLGRTIQTVEPVSGNRYISYDAFSRKLTTTDALGNVTSYVYNDTSRSVVVTTQEGISLTTVHNRHGQTATVTDPRNNLTTYNYNINGQLESIVDPVGTQVSNTYDRAGRMLTTTDARGIVTTIAYDVVNRVFTRTVDSASGGLALVTTHVYDGQGRVTDITDPTGRLTRTSYDKDGRVTQVAIDPAGLNLRTSYEYDRSGHTITVTEGVGGTSPRRTQYKYDNLGRRTEEIVDPTELGGTLNLRTQYRYDANGNLTRKIDPNGNSTWYVHDADNRLRYTVNALGTVKETVYDAEDRVIATRNYANAISTAAFGNVVTSVTVSVNATADQVVQSVYDRDGREKYTIGATGTVTERTFDNSGNVTRTRVYANAIAAGTYTTLTSVSSALTTAGNNTSTLSTNDRVGWVAYDERGRAIYNVDGVGAVIRTVRDGNGNATTTTAFATLRDPTLAMDMASLNTWAATTAIANHVDNRVERFWRDGADREVFKLDGDGYLTETRYNDSARRTSKILYRTKPTIAIGATLAQVKTNSVVTGFSATNDRVSTSENDVAGRVIRMFDALTTAAAATYEEFTYDAVGNRISSIDPRGAELAEKDTAWARAERVRLTYPIDASALSTAQRNALRARYTTVRAYDAAGRLITITDPTGGITRKKYDAFGNLVKLTDPRGNVGYTYYDANGRVRYQIDPSGYVTEKRYDTLGNVTDEFSYATALTGSWDETTTLANINSRIALDAARDRRISKTYDQRGSALVITHYGNASNYTEEFHYNAFGDKRDYKDRNGAIFDYRYNARGNLTREILPAVTVVTAVLPNVVSSSVRLENAYEYNAFGQLFLKQEAAGTAQQRETRIYYNNRGLERRIEMPSFAVFNRATGATTTQTPAIDKTYDAAGNLVLEVRPNGGRAVNYYDNRNLLVASVDPDNVLRQYTYDAVGNLASERTYDTRLTGVQDPATTPTAVNPTLYRELTHVYNANNLRVETSTRAETLFSWALMQAGDPDGYYEAAVVTRAEYDANGNVYKTTDGNGYPTFQYYDTKGNRILQVDGNRYVTRWEYNAQGLVTRETKYAGQLTQTFVNSLTISTTVATITAAIPAGDDRITEYDYDKLGRMTVERKMGISYASVNSTNGALTETTGNVVTGFEYDGNGNRTAQVNPGAHGRIDWQYDALGRRTRETDPQFQAFNGRGQALVAVRSQVNWQYDAFGNIAVQTQLGQTTAEDRETRYQYDLAGNLRTERGPEGAQTTYDFDISGNATRSSRQVTDVDNVAHTYRTYYTYDIVSRVTVTQDIEDEGAPSQVTRETKETRYNAHGDVEAAGINGQFQEKFIYDKLGRLFWTNKENGTPRVYIYDANGNAVLEIRAINTDLSQVNPGTGLRPIAGPSDAVWISPTSAQFTVSFFDGRNQLVSVFQPPMDFGDLINTPPTVETVGTPGPAPEGIPPVTPTTGSMGWVNGQNRSLDPPPPPSTISDNTSGAVYAYGDLPGNSSTPSAVTVTPGMAGLSPSTIVDPPITATQSDTVSADGLTRTVVQTLTEVRREITFVQEGATFVRVTTRTTDVTTRTIVFRRASSSEFGANEQSLETEWVVDPTTTTSTSRNVDVQRDRFSRTQTTNVTGAYVGTNSSVKPLGSLAFNGAQSITFVSSFFDLYGHVQGEWAYPAISLQVFLPALEAYGSGPTRVEILQPWNNVTWIWELSGAGSQGTSWYNPGFNTDLQVRITKGGQTILDTMVWADWGTQSIDTPATVSIRGQNGAAHHSLFRTLDEAGNPTSGWIGANLVSIPGFGPEFVYSGSYSANQRYEYIVYDASNNVLNSVQGRLGGAHNNQYYQTTRTVVTQAQAQEANGYNNYLGQNGPTQGSQQQNNYLRRLLMSITQGTSSAREIRRSQTYNAFGDIISQTDGRNNRTDFTYNDLGKLTMRRAPETDVYPEQGASIRLRPTDRNYYDEVGQLVATQDANSDQLAAGQKYYTTRVLVNGRIEKEFDPLGNVVRYTYDRLGNQRQKFNQLNLETENQYDRNGRLTRTNRYDAAGTLYTYDSYEYDQAGNRKAHTNGLNDRETYLFDGQNRVRRHVSFHNRQTTYGYTYQSTIGGVGGYEKTTTTAGVTGNDVATDRTDYFGHIRFHQDIGGHTFNYVYNNAGWLKEQNGTTAATGRLNQLITYEYYGNGLLKAINDSGISSYALFQYDNDGNRIVEAYSQVPIAPGVQSTFPYQVISAEYDELNRVKRARDVGRYDVRYQYDAVGNRRSVQTTWNELLTVQTQNQNFFYTYDKLNRFVITMGSRDTADSDGDGNTQEIIRGPAGYEIQYDVAGRRQNVLSDHLNTSGQVQRYTESYTYDPTDTLKETRVIDRGNGNAVLARTERLNNAIGQMREYREFEGLSTLRRQMYYEYDRDSLTTLEEDRTDAERERTVYNYVGNGIMTSSVASTVNTSGTPIGGRPVVNIAYTHEKWDDYKNSTVTVSSQGYGWITGQSTYKYDSNGHIKELFDRQASRTTQYINNQDGLVLRRYTIDREINGSDKPAVWRHFYALNGITIGDVGLNDSKQILASRVDYAQSLASQEKNGKKVYPQIGDRVFPVTSADFDQNYQPINPSYPRSAPGSYVVRQGETLQAIALGLWGDASLWYLLADANGLSGTETLVAGTRLTIPNVVTNFHNNAQTFRPVDLTLALGDTSPTIPDPPPPPPAKKGCGVLGLIIIIVIVIVVSVLSAGAAAAPASSAGSAAAGTAGATTAGGATVAGSTAAAGTATAGTAAAGTTVASTTAVTAGAAGAGGGGFSALWAAGTTALTSNIGAAAFGGAMGSIAGQGAAMAMGMQEKFSWKGVAIGAISAGVTAGLGQLASSSSAFGTAIQAFRQSNPYTFLALNGAASSALTQGISVATGLQNSFSWRDVAISGISAPVSAAIGNGASALFGPSDLGQYAANFVSRVGGSLVRKAFGDGRSTAEILTDAAVNAIFDPKRVQLEETSIEPPSGGNYNPGDQLEEVVVTAKRLPVSADEGGSYTVQRGDSLFAIAERELGDGNLWPTIAQMNGISDPNHIVPGQDLRLPDTASFDVKAARAQAGEFYAQDAAARTAIERAWQETLHDALRPTLDDRFAEAFDRALLSPRRTVVPVEAGPNAHLPPIEDPGFMPPGFFASAYYTANDLLWGSNSSWVDRTVGFVGAVGTAIPAFFEEAGRGMYNAIPSANVAGQYIARASLAETTDEQVLSSLYAVQYLAGGFNGLAGPASMAVPTPMVPGAFNATFTQSTAELAAIKATYQTVDDGFVGPLIGRSGFRSTTELADEIFVRSQRYVDQAYPAALAAEARGLLKGPANVRVGNEMDRIVRARMRTWLDYEGIADDVLGVGTVQVNRRLYDPLNPSKYRIPDIRVPGAQRTFDYSLEFKLPSTHGQVRDILRFSNDKVTIVRPLSHPDGGSYSIIP